MNDFSHRASCRPGTGVDPEIFFPTADPWMKPDLYKEQAHDAKAVCARCPVRRECLERGMAIPFGVFGGLTPEERRLRRPTSATRGRVFPHPAAEMEPASAGRA